MGSSASQEISKTVLRRRRRQRLIAWGSFLAVVAVALSALPAYRALKGWRARQLATQADGFIRQENWTDAAAKLKAAYQLKPTDPLVIRTVARMEGISGRSASALTFWKQLKEGGDMTFEDRRLALEDMLRCGNLVEAEEEAAAMLSERPKDGPLLRSRARIAIARQQLELSLQFARKAVEADPENREGQLLLALLEVESPDAGTRKAGMDKLLKLARGTDKYSLGALGAAASRRDLPASEVDAVMAMLRGHPLATDTHRLLVLDLELGRNPDGRKELVDKAVSDYSKASPESKRALAVWLNAHQEYDATMRLVPEEEAKTRKDLLLVYLDALAALKQWRRIQEILSAKAVPLEEAYAELFLARSAMELGNPTEAELHWRRAHLAGAPSPEQMWFLGTYAEKIGQLDQAESAYKSLVNNAMTARPAYIALLRLAERRGGEIRQTRNVLGAMMARWPSDTAVENDYTYLGLLLGLDLEKGLEAGKRLVEKAPKSLPHRTTLALGYLRLNQPGKALEVYNGLNVRWNEVGSSQRAVYAAVLAANGRLEEAKQLAGTVRANEIRVEERRLIEGLL